MIAILKNDLARLWRSRSRIFLNVGITAGMILIALFFSSRPPVAGRIAFVGNAAAMPKAPAGYELVAADVTPRESDLVSGKYDAIVSVNAAGGYAVTTLKSADFERRLLAAIEGKAVPGGTEYMRGRGSTIAGFLLMFIMMQGTITLYLFADDKELKILPRIASTPVSIPTYLGAHSLFTFIAILAPDLAVLYAIKFITGMDIGFTFAQYLALFAVAAILATAFSLFLNALASKGDTANMAGSAIVTLTSVLAGSFYSFERGNLILEALVKALPQKAWLESATSIERGLPPHDAIAHLVYPLALSLVFFALAFAKTGRDYRGAR
jgi:ABC-2 type transport system permease protein